MTLRDALVALEKELRERAEASALKADKPHQDDATTNWHQGRDEAFSDGADAIAALLSAHPAVEGDAVERALAGLLAYRGTYEGEVPIEADDMRAALDAAWPGMVADARRFNWYFASDRTSTDEFCQLMIRSLDPAAWPELNEWRTAIDAAMEASRG